MSGVQFGTYLQRYILGPLELAQTSYYMHLPPRLPLMAAGYEKWQQPAQNVERFDASSIGGALLTTASDYSRFIRALYGGRLLSAASTARLTASSFALPPSEQAGAGATGITAAGALVTSDGAHRVLGDTWSLADFGLGTVDDYVPASHIAVILVNNLVSRWPADGQALILGRIHSLSY